MLNRPCLCGMLIVFQACAGAWADGQTLVSPDGSLSATIDVDSSRLTWTVQRDGQDVVTPSPMGVTVDGSDMGLGVELGDGSFRSIDESYPWRGPYATGVNRCNELTIPVTHPSTGQAYSLEVRAYDDGVAYRYVIPGGGPRTVSAEASAWNLPTGTELYYQPGRKHTNFDQSNYESHFKSSPADDVDTVRDADGIDAGFIWGPVTAQLPGGGYLAVTEGHLENYSGAAYEPVDGSHRFRVFFQDGQTPLAGRDGTSWGSPPDVSFDIAGPITTPWRITMVSDDLDGLVNSPIVHAVNPPADPAVDWSFVQPGRSVWSWFRYSHLEDTDQRVALEKRYIDAAAELGFEYTVIDDGWKDMAPARLDEILNHAEDRGVDFFLWKHSRELTDASDRADFLDWAAGRGAVGIKVDFMNSESLDTVAFQRALLADAADRGLMINFHGSGKGTGEPRTFPNEITREGIRGMEHRDFTPEHNLLAIWTRGLAGSMDYTPVVLNSGYMRGTSWAYQLATAVAFQSDIQHWADDPQNYLDHPAVDVIRRIPATWDQTRVLPGSSLTGQGVLARRKGEQWFLALLSGTAGDRTETISLDFLADDGFAGYRAVILGDTPGSALAYDRQDRVVDPRELLQVFVRDKGGLLAVFDRLLPGDADGSGAVDVSDLGILAGAWGTEDGSALWMEGDFTGDGRVDVGDLGILAGQWGAGSVPEPTSLMMLAACALAGVRRRR